MGDFEGMATKPTKITPEFERAYGIASEHIAYAKRYPKRLLEFANRIGTTTNAALSLMITEDIIDAFDLTLKP
jgi:hypothetical protein